MVAYSKGMEVGTPAPPFALPATDGKTYSLATFADAPALVVVFTCNHCPYSKAVEDRLVALQRDYAPRGVRLVAINPNDDVAYPDDSFTAMVERAKQKGFNFPYLRDEGQAVATCWSGPPMSLARKRLSFTTPCANTRASSCWAIRARA